MSDFEDIELEMDTDTDTDNTTDIESETSELSIPFYEKINSLEKEELITTIQELIEDYLKTDVLKMSRITFHIEMVDDITGTLFASLQDANICKESDYDSLLEFVDNQCDEYFEEKINEKCPARTVTHYHENVYLTEYGIPEDVIGSILDDKITTLKKLDENNPAQRTPAWYEKRCNMLTASNLWQALASYAQQNRLIYEKCKQFDERKTATAVASPELWTNTESSLHWGVRYEPLTVMVYEKLTGAQISDFGCIQHSKYPFIGASPDGIVTNRESKLYGRMVEIKNIFNREMNGIPSEAYWIQTQIQLECCDLDVCDFVETQFKEYDGAIQFWEEPDESRMRGVVLYFILKNGTSNIPLYKYMPLDIPLEEDAISDWIKKTRQEVPADYTLFKTIYWYLENIAMSIVLRNSVWFDAALPQIKSVWRTIEKERVEGYHHRISVKRTSSNENKDEPSSLGQSPSTSRGIGKRDKGICLIKLP